MNRTRLVLAGFSSASSLLLVDSTVKGTAILVLAAIAALILRRDSAATRHLVWLLAIVATLVVPVLSAMLPQWRVLPVWAGISPISVVVETSPPGIARPGARVASLPRNVDRVEVERPTATHAPSPAEPLESRPAPAIPEITPEPAVWRGNWINAPSFVWAIGFSLLMLRLLAARTMLWNSERQATVIWSRRQRATAPHDHLVTAFEAASLHLGIRRPVSLLIHRAQTIPVVWGILRSRLLLPAAARNWSGEQLRSVLLHELAHLKRRDTTSQLLAQFACTLYWFNPLVWFAGWRLSVERERACDDLVLASGVRPSAYAAHLLEVVSGRPPARWTQSCGLAMARKSTLECRLVAVLSENLNRRGVSVVLGAIGLAIAAGFAVPIAMLHAADEQPGTQVEQQPQKPPDRATLEPGDEEKLAWGEPVNGLRAALAIRPAPGGPKAGARPELFLAVQNVSKAPIRFSDTAKAPQLRRLTLRRDGETLFRIVTNDPTLTHVMLRPREVAFLLMFVSDQRDNEGRTEGAAFAEGALRDVRDTLIAEMKLEHAPAGAWTGKLVTAETSGSVASGQPQPKDKKAKALYKTWQRNARKNGNIPGGFIGRLGKNVNEFIRLDSASLSGVPHAKKLEPLVPRFDASHDWSLANAVALLDDIAAACAVPLDAAMDEAIGLTLNPGAPLPPELANAPWGQPLPSGLRMAWLLEPRAAEHRLGTPLESRIFFHNAGKNAVVFRTRAWHQGCHTARDANGANVKIESVDLKTTGLRVPFRLWPGEFVEVNAAGIGIGPIGDPDNWQNASVGSWVEPNVGDEVTLTTGPVPLGDLKDEPSGGEQGWWLDLIIARLARELPLPADPDERERLVYRAGMDLFGTPLAEAELAAFVSDRQPAALDSLARRLANRPNFTPCSGALQSAPTRFRVLPADPLAATKPQVTRDPGRFTLGPNVRLVVSRRPDAPRIVNEANIEFVSSDPAKPVPARPHEIKLPDGFDTWAAAWQRGGAVLWVRHEGHICSYDFTNPAQVKETTFEKPADLEKVPGAVRDALRARVDAPAVPAAPAASN